VKAGYTVWQTKKALSKTWIGYTIAKNRGENERLKYYASVMQKLQRTARCMSTISGKISQQEIDEK
jgi:hypothetical protein